MPQVSFALRDDPCSIFLLQDAGTKYEDYCQIAVFSRNIIRPEFFRQYLSFAPFVGVYEKVHNDVTKVRFSIEDNQLVPSYNYVAMIDSEVEFTVTTSVIKQFSRNFIPSFTVKSFLDYFFDCKTGFLLFLRVYKVNQELPPSLLENGVRGGSKILRLYDHDGNRKFVDIDGLVPVISDNKFSYLKNEILHMLKIDNAFIASFDSTDDGLKKLQKRADVDRLFSGNHQYWENQYMGWLNDDSSDDSEFDRAKLDYDEIFREVVKICPGMTGIVDYVKNIQAARLGEYDYLFNILFTNSDNKDFAFSRLFDVTLRSAVKNALYAYQKDGIDLEDAFQTCCIGIIFAIKKYNDSVKGLFPSYAAMWMQQILGRKYSIYDCNVRVPVHYYDFINNVLTQLEKIVGVIDFKTISFSELYNLLLKHTDCNSVDALRVCYITIPALSIEDIIEDENDDLSMVFSSENFVDDVLETLSYSKVQEAFSVLTPKEKDVIFRRFGFNGLEESTLEQVGQLLGVTRERIRQIEVKAKRKIFDYFLGKSIFSDDLDSGLDFDSSKPVDEESSFALDVFSIDVDESNPVFNVPHSSDSLSHKCSECGHELSMNCSSGENACPVCSLKVLRKGYNDLETLYPEIAKDWHPTKNKGKLPSDFMPNSRKKVWWFCEKCGLEWKAEICERIEPDGSCPQCTKKHGLPVRYIDILKKNYS